MVWALAAIVLTPWLAVGWLGISAQAEPGQPPTSSSPTALSTARRASEQRSGPWGRLELSTIRIEVPDDYVFLPTARASAVRWAFPASDAAAARALARGAGLTEAELATLDGAGWRKAGGLASTQPSLALVLSLRPDVRARLYALLSSEPTNEHLVDPIWFRDGQVDEVLAGSKLRTTTVDLIKRLLYPGRDGLLLFTDFVPASQAVSDERERHELLRTLSRKRAVLARLVTERNAPLERIVSFWSEGGREQEVGPLLEALQREGRGAINVLALLPRYARDRLYTHPVPSTDPAARAPDCFYSALNFFNDTPDERFHDPAVVSATLKRDYFPVEAPTRLGDLVLLVRPDGSVAHAANWVADGVVFTKNGGSFTQPWILMRLDELLATYRARLPAGQALEVKTLRRQRP